MKLSAECIQYHLSKEYKTRLFSSDPERVYGAPVIFQENIDWNGNMVIADISSIHTTDTWNSTDVQHAKTPFQSKDPFNSTADALLRSISRTKSGLVLLISPSYPWKKRTLPLPVLWICSDETSETEIYNFIKKIFEMFDSWDEQMKKIVFDVNREDNRYEALAKCFENYFDIQFAIIDNSNHYVAFSEKYYQEYILPNGASKNYSVPWKYVNDTTMRKEWKTILGSQDIFSLEFGDSDCNIMGRNIIHNQKSAGHIGFVIKSAEDFAYYSFVLNNLQYYVQNLYNQTGSFPHTVTDRSRQTNLIYQALEKHNADADIWEESFEQIGWKANEPLLVTAFELNQAYNSPKLDDELYAQNLGNELLMKWDGILPFQNQKNLYLIVNLRQFISGDNTDYKSVLSVFVRDNLIYAGLSRIFYHVREFEEGMKQAKIAIDYGTKYDSSIWCHEYNTYVLQLIRQNAVGDLKKESVCSEKILKLIQYDAEKNTEYYKTLLTYFQCHFHSSDTARALFIQRSTFQYRMERIEKISGIDLSSFEEISYYFWTFGLLEAED